MKFQKLYLWLILLASAQLYAVPLTYTTLLTGPNENPTNSSPGTGTAIVTIDTTAHLLTLNVVFSGLTDVTTASHIHCCVAPPGTAGVATQTPSFTGFPLGVTSGTFVNSFDTSLTGSWNQAFINANGGTTAGAEAALAAGLAAGQAYLNIHTSAFPNGEIRGFLVAVPEPTTLGVVGFALAGLLALRRRSSV
jgi:hypothetical protein